MLLKGRDNSKVKTWQPVALLNTDYIFLTKVLAKRLANHTPSVIHPDQSGFVKHRFIGESIRFTEDIIELFDREERQEIIIIWFWKGLWLSGVAVYAECVEKNNNLEEKIISFVKCCYIHIFSCVTNNDFSTNWFSLYRGMRQGCPLSCLLFILWAEIWVIESEK